MKLVCLNLWAGKLYDDLMQFLKAHSKDTNVFCFQEVTRSQKNSETDRGYRTGLLSDLEILLKDYTAYFAPMIRTRNNLDFMGKTDFPVEFGQAIFVKKSLKVMSVGEKIIHKGKKKIVDPQTDLNRIANHVKIKLGNNALMIFNFHGLSTWPKTDTPERIRQSTVLRKYIDKSKCRKILCGDFNLDPESKSLVMLEENMKNLIKNFSVKSTRPSVSNFTDSSSDYVIVSPEIKVKSFSVPDMYISDHLPLILEFEL